MYHGTVKNWGSNKLQQVSNNVQQVYLNIVGGFSKSCNVNFTTLLGYCTRSRTPAFAVLPGTAGTVVRIVLARGAYCTGVITYDTYDNINNNNNNNDDDDDDDDDVSMCA
jgi:hypothetical protein